MKYQYDLSDKFVKIQNNTAISVKIAFKASNNSM